MGLKSNATSTRARPLREQSWDEIRDLFALAPDAVRHDRHPADLSAVWPDGPAGAVLTEHENTEFRP